MKTKLQHADLLNPQAGKVVPLQLLVTDSWKHIGEQSPGRWWVSLLNAKLKG